MARHHAARIRAVYLRRPRDPGRAGRTRELVQEIRVHGVESLMVDGSDDVARHAAARGWISRTGARRAG